MGHITSKDAYKSLEERINWFTQGLSLIHILLFVEYIFLKRNINTRSRKHWL